MSQQALREDGWWAGWLKGLTGAEAGAVGSGHHEGKGAAMEVEPTGLRELSQEECLQHLASHEGRIGRLAFIVAGAPLNLPVNFALHRGRIVFRTSLGTKLDHLGRGTSVAFEVDEVDPELRAGWSVLVLGIAEEVTDLTEVAALRRLPLQSWAAGRRDRYVRIETRSMTGRELVSYRAGLNDTQDG
jgi:nitroimidazol reductase NimA-like FMN-containing flavoprotein (pyridoxamine 5'-phosphate oxidase superfamily)